MKLIRDLDDSDVDKFVYDSYLGVWKKIVEIKKSKFSNSIRAVHLTPISGMWKTCKLLGKIKESSTGLYENDLIENNLPDEIKEKIIGTGKVELINLIM